MKTKSLSKHDFDVLLIPCIERMISKEESHLENLKAQLSKKSSIFSFIDLKSQIKSMITSSENMLIHYKFRLKEYKDYAKKLK